MPVDFYRLSPIEFNFALDDWQDTERTKWERVRLLSFYVFNSSMNIKKVLNKPENLFKFDWEGPKEKVVYTEADFERIRKRDKKVFAKLKELKAKEDARKNAKGVNN